MTDPPHSPSEDADGSGRSEGGGGPDGSSRPERREGFDGTTDGEVLLSVVTAADVAHRLAQLRDRFGQFPVRDERRENDDAYFAEAVALAGSGWRGDAGTFVTDLDGRVLLVEHADAPSTWGTPGGGHEPGESLATTARRETREETGLDPALTGVHEAVRTTIVHEDDPTRTITMLTVHFEGIVGASEPDLVVGDDEIQAAEWFETPPSSLHEHCAAWVRETLEAFDSTPGRAARRTRVHADATIENLTAEYDDVPVREDRLDGDEDAFANWMQATRDDARVGSAYVLVVRHGDDAPPVSPSMPTHYEYDRSRALLVMGRAEDEWTVPGGGVERGESFDAAAEREVREETGIDCEVTGIHEIVRGVGVRERDGRELHFVHVVFHARYRQGVVELQASELNGACWFREPPESEHWLVERVLDDWRTLLEPADASLPDPDRDSSASATDLGGDPTASATDPGGDSADSATDSADEAGESDDA